MEVTPELVRAARQSRREAMKKAQTIRAAIQKTKIIETLENRLMSGDESSYYLNSQDYTEDTLRIIHKHFESRGFSVSIERVLGSVYLKVLLPEETVLGWLLMKFEELINAFRKN